ncbi:Uncharacterized protein Adt_18004 [Abeliophyllum distichum]|uniref:Uncharacterized protein n=1 Tax=Abeliophyllum distichum TaxID=126358 RepID=A0ABD1TI48_9LAMI
MEDEKVNEIVTLFEEILAELFHATKPRQRPGTLKLVSPLRKFSNKSKIKIFKSRKFGSCSAVKSKNLGKSPHSGSSVSDGFVSKSIHVTSPRKWSDYTTSKESLEPMMVTEMTPDSDD